jgi:hypothetical protein
MRRISRTALVLFLLSQINPQMGWAISEINGPVENIMPTSVLVNPLPTKKSGKNPTMMATEQPKTKLKPDNGNMFASHLFFP